MDDFIDYYAILGVTNKATTEEIKRAYRDKCFILHDDRMQTAPESARKRAHEELKLVNRAYDVLKDARKRKDYDAQWIALKDKPKPVVEPRNIQFGNVKPGETRTASFVVRNDGGPYRTISIPNPGTWVTLAEWHSVSTSDELPLKVSIRAEAPTKGKKFSEIITVKLDDEKAHVAVSLSIKRGPHSIAKEIEEQISKPLSHVGKNKRLCSLLFVFALSLVGLGISAHIGSFIPFWLLLSFSVIFSVEKWLSYYIYARKYKIVGKIYRLVLNLSVLSLLGLLISSCVLLFTQQFLQSPLIGSFLFLTELIALIWLSRVVSRNSWRQPSMKLTVFCVICLFLVFSFAGVQPMAHYKDVAIAKIANFVSD
jgi:curved DNA-binding protein CbpA